MNPITTSQRKRYATIVWTEAIALQEENWEKAAEAAIKAYLADQDPKALPYPWVRVKDQAPTATDGDAHGYVLWAGRENSYGMSVYSPWDNPRGATHWMPVPDMRYFDNLERVLFESTLSLGDCCLERKDGKYLAPGIEDMWQGYLLAKTNETSK